jgi:curved DNA-binding protein CbpA
MSDRDYYEILGLTPRADGMMVDQAYWHLARKYQALAQTNPSARTMLDELNEAYGVLGTPRLRQQYDAFRDDVLIRKGMIKPVSSKQKREKKQKTPRVVANSDRGTAEHRIVPRVTVSMPEITLPSVRIPREHWPWYAGGAACAAFLGGTAWLGVNPIIAVGIACAVIALAATRALRRQLPAITLTMPQISAPELRTPRIDVPKPRLPELSLMRQASGPPEDGVSAGELRDSTAAMISHWRNSVGLKPPAEAPLDTRSGEPAQAPSTTLMDIVSTERRLQDDDQDGDPLAAVIDILRGSSTRIPETRQQ